MVETAAVGGVACKVVALAVARKPQKPTVETQASSNFFIRYLLNIQSFLLHHEANLLLHRLRSGAESPHPPAEWSYYRKPGTLRLFANEVSIVAVIRH